MTEHCPSYQAKSEDEQQMYLRKSTSVKVWPHIQTDGQSVIRVRISQVRSANKRKRQDRP